MNRNWNRGTRAVVKIAKRQRKVITKLETKQADGLKVVSNDLLAVGVRFRRCGARSMKPLNPTGVCFQLSNKARLSIRSLSK